MVNGCGKQMVASLLNQAKNAQNNNKYVHACTLSHGKINRKMEDSELCSHKIARTIFEKYIYIAKIYRSLVHVALNPLVPLVRDPIVRVAENVEYIMVSK